MNELQAFEKHLRENEKSPATIEKYLRDARAFLCWLDGRKPTKELTVCYKEGLTERYEAASVNSMLAGINSYLSFSGRADCRVKPLRVQRTLFGSEERELSREEYTRLVRAAGGAQIGVVMQTICGTGIRVSELRHITAEAVRDGRAAVRNKGKTRVILIPAALRRLLLGYMKKAGVTTGSVFLSKNKTPLDRSTVWRRMKALCERAGGGPAQGLSPFSAASVRPRLLQRGKGPAAACGHPRPRQREHHPHLHHGNRTAAHEAAGARQPNTAHIMAILLRNCCNNPTLHLHHNRDPVSLAS